MTRESLKATQCKYTCQDGNREFISLLACICADGTALPPALIYQSNSYDIQSTWVQDLGVKNNDAFIATSESGWTSDTFGKNWLVNIFDRFTKSKAGNRRRLLIVDGHSSHVNLAFLEMCDKLRIIVHILPAHSTHKLQPLDVGLFSPLATYYSDGLNKCLYSSIVIVSMTKNLFYPILRMPFRKLLRSQISKAHSKKPAFFHSTPK